MNSRVVGLSAVLGLLVVAAALLAVAPVAVAQSGDGAGNATQSHGDYSLNELRDGGKMIENGPDSQRFMGQYGSATLRYEPVGPLKNGWEYLDREMVLHNDELELRTVRLAPEQELQRTVNVTVVGWQEGTRTVARNNTTVERRAAVNQTVIEQQVTLGRGYDTATIDLPSSYGEEQTVTIWLEQYPDARWKTQHLSNPSTQAIDIDSQGEAWWYSVKTAILPGLAGLFIGFMGGRKALDRTGSGPRWGLVVWGVISAVLLFALTSAWYFQVATVLTYAPVLMGGVFAVGGFGLGLYSGGSPSKIGFYKAELFDARLGPTEPDSVHDAGEGREPLTDGGRVLNGDNPETETESDGDAGETPGTGLRDIKEARYVDLKELPANRTPSGSIRVPKRGMRPFLARLFADAAELDKGDLTTKIEVDQGRLEEILMVDPEADEVVDHKPARLERRLPFMHSVDDDAETDTKLTAAAGMVTVLVGLPAVGFLAGSAVGVPILGAAVGALPGLIASHTAKDGSIEFEPATQHFQRAQATLIDLQREQADGKTLEKVREDYWKEIARTANEAKDLSTQRDETISHELDREVAGIDMDDLSAGDAATPDAGGDADDE